MQPLLYPTLCSGYACDYLRLGRKVFFNKKRVMIAKALEAAITRQLGDALAFLGSNTGSLPVVWHS